LALDSFLRRHRRLAFDTSVLIDQFESHPAYQKVTARIFAWLESSGHSAVTSTIAMTEFLVVPYRDLPAAKVSGIYGILSRYPNLEWITLDLAIADLAANLRARLRLAVADAIQAATAIHSGATGLVTNDRAFKRVTEIEILVLEDTTPS
jgi:predicted nucleic acid-binding protein